MPLSKVPVEHRISGDGDWVSTEEMCAQLDVCRSTLYRVRTALMSEGTHYTRKNPTSIRCGHLLWNPDEVKKVFRRCH